MTDVEEGAEEPRVADKVTPEPSSSGTEKTNQAISSTTDTTSTSAPSSTQPPPADYTAPAPSSKSDEPNTETSSNPPAQAGPLSTINPNSPAPRRPKPPTKGILKPPPPPAKPTLSNRLRDIVTVVGGGAKSLFELEETPGAGPSSPAAPVGPSVGGTLNAISGKLGLGLSRFVAATSQPNNTAPSSTPTGASGRPAGSPVVRSVSLPESTAGVSERARQKQPLKRATFLLPSMSITYPISSTGEPWSQKVLEDRKRIESTHRSLLTTTTGAQYWTSQRLVGLYESACKGREERPRVGIVRALEVLPNPPRPRHIHIILKPTDGTTAIYTAHIIDAPLNRHAAEALADVLTAEWGLVDLKLENGVVDGDDALKAILHALLISGTLPTLSLAGNKKIKAGGWRLLAVFLKRARSLRFVDLSDTSWDKRGIDYLVQALTCAQVRPLPLPDKEGNGTVDGNTPSQSPEDITTPLPSESVDEKEADLPDDPKEERDSYGSFIPRAPLLKEAEDEARPAAVQSLRMDGCMLRANVLEALAQGVRSSDLKNISLRRNRIGPLGAVALAIMIRDYPDASMTMTPLSSQLNSVAQSGVNGTTIERTPSPLPYAARQRRIPKMEDESTLPPIPLVVSSAAGGVTTRTLPEGYKPPAPPRHPLVMPIGGNSAMQEMPSASFGLNQMTAEGKLSNPDHGGASMALQRSVRALDGVERIGRLLTLDLKSNEIKNGVGYIAQVLKRNRTLKVLNLGDNRIDGAGLALLAEALKYNSTLETLDLSNNPCCGPLSEGIAALRTAFTVNTSLKRLFLADTGLTTDGAISLAEFLPESKSLLHLDLTSNPNIDTAGILAISVGLKANTLIRCLDVSIPPNNPELAEISQNILQSCIRNTELAASSVEGGKADSLWVPIKKSTLVRNVKQAEDARAEKERADLVKSPEGKAREYVYKLKPDAVPGVIEKTLGDCEKWFEAGEVFTRARGVNVVWEPGQLPKDDWIPLLQRARVLRERVGEILGETTDEGEMLEKLLKLNDALTAILERSKGFIAPPRLLLPSQIVPTQAGPATPNGPTKPTVQGLGAPVGNGRFLSRRHMRGHSLEISSPNFSIGDSDGESDAEELDVGRIPASTPISSLASVEVDGGGLGLGDDEAIRGEQGRVVGTQSDRIAELREGEAGEEVASPVGEASRAWVEEEGEIFRKGTVLGVGDDEEDDEDVPGELLKQEILDTPVARTNTRRRMSVDEADEGGQGDEGRGGSPE